MSDGVRDNYLNPRREELSRGDARIAELEAKCEEMGDLLTGYYAAHQVGSDPMRTDCKCDHCKQFRDGPGDVHRKRIAELRAALAKLLPMCKPSLAEWLNRSAYEGYVKVYKEAQEAIDAAMAKEPAR